MLLGGIVTDDHVVAIRWWGGRSSSRARLTRRTGGLWRPGTGSSAVAGETERPLVWRGVGACPAKTKEAFVTKRRRRPARPDTLSRAHAIAVRSLKALNVVKPRTASCLPSASRPARAACRAGAAHHAATDRDRRAARSETRPSPSERTDE